ncbi:hypothetical protein TREMEDRAFT_63821 [Tremella mesenterica DSM 1558]|uniref:uncharacterized protein n=1 Tax=Tremella mesenterica (strain ATCC 24925 / CBS 8224 / DSM 1558 / NBRC 9311 / NRRL Y-6157 / RJB 2259-6 / UBC 559-6) TaxID=578456 RepID=UPI0003F495CC|nr:uncharacterized protein TREMEDRAFT_63821 [Tremella mesenterica DSM 1558]EIW67933.1 hypothetical protein TREMEDRAFT_63821 [Tremella mesenterica DSM 1558]
MPATAVKFRQLDSTTTAIRSRSRGRSASATDAASTSTSIVETTCQKVRNILDMTIANIIWKRNIFDHENLEVHELQPESGDHMASSLNVRRLKKDHSSHINWILQLLNGVMEAITRGYLRTLNIVVLLDPKDPNNIIEAYRFDFVYSALGAPGIAFGESTPTSPDVYRMMRAVQHTLINACDELDPLPADNHDQSFLDFRLTYYGHTPTTYEPPNFQLFRGDVWFGTRDANQQPYERIAGSTFSHPLLHKINVRLTSIANLLPRESHPTDYPGDISASWRRSGREKDAQERNIAWVSNSDASIQQAGQMINGQLVELAGQHSPFHSHLPGIIVEGVVRFCAKNSQQLGTNDADETMSLDRSGETVTLVGHQYESVTPDDPDVYNCNLHIQALGLSTQSHSPQAPVDDHETSSDGEETTQSNDNFRTIPTSKRKQSATCRKQARSSKTRKRSVKPPASKRKPKGRVQRENSKEKRSAVQSKNDLEKKEKAKCPCKRQCGETKIQCALCCQWVHGTYMDDAIEDAPERFKCLFCRIKQQRVYDEDVKIKASVRLLYLYRQVVATARRNCKFPESEEMMGSYGCSDIEIAALHSWMLRDGFIDSKATASSGQGYMKNKLSHLSFAKLMSPGGPVEQQEFAIPPWSGFREGSEMQQHLDSYLSKHTTESSPAGLFSSSSVYSLSASRRFQHEPVNQLHGVSSDTPQGQLSLATLPSQSQWSGSAQLVELPSEKTSRSISFQGVVEDSATCQLL